MSGQRRSIRLDTRSRPRPNDHLITEIEGDRWLIDTGAPTSFGAVRRIELDGQAFDIPSSYMGLDHEKLTEFVGTLDQSPVIVHQRTLDRLTDFIDRFRSLNFAGDAQLETTLEQFREELLTRPAEDYRNDRSAMTNLTDGLERLRESAVQLAHTDARDIISRFGQMGGRRLAAVS